MGSEIDSVFKRALPLSLSLSPFIISPTSCINLVDVIFFFLFYVTVSNNIIENDRSKVIIDQRGIKTLLVYISIQ